ncbi:hypothetical protein J6590_039951 [Homalodisca vitripennis]|nr:hypothetical protein J6590_039944 [Homalodisca vitripennis]KAG8326489.1 hypothetical protein J6590_039951 [Homalodisca vitripennis]
MPILFSNVTLVHEVGTAPYRHKFALIYNDINHSPHCRRYPAPASTGVVSVVVMYCGRPCVSQSSVMLHNFLPLPRSRQTASRGLDLGYAQAQVIELVLWANNASGTL